MGRYEEAVEHQRRSLTLAQKTQDRAAQANALSDLGISLLALQQVDAALDALKLALTSGQEMEYQALMSQTHKYLADWYENQGQPQEAIDSCERALNIATALGIPLAQDCEKFKERLLNEQSGTSDSRNR